MEQFLVEEENCGEKIEKSLYDFESKIRKFSAIQQNQIQKLKQMLTKNHDELTKLKGSIEYYQIKYDDMRNIAEYEAKNVRIVKQKHAEIVRKIDDDYKKKIKELAEEIEKIKKGEIIDL